MYALESVRHIAAGLARAVKDGNDLEAREHVAFANTLSGYVMTMTRLTSQHPMEHALSAFHQELPHGAGLIMLSLAYFGHMIKTGARTARLRSSSPAHRQAATRCTPKISSVRFTSCRLPAASTTSR